MELKTAFNANDLTITLDGYEKLNRKRHFIINTVHTLSKYQDSCALPGSYTFPFSIALPVDLPSSFQTLNTKTDTSVKIKYHLTAEMFPIKSL